MARGQWTRMDLQTRDRADQDVEALSDRQSDLSQARGRGSQAPGPADAHLDQPAVLVAVAVACAVAIVFAMDAGVKGVGAVPAVIRTGLVTVAFCALCGWAPARHLIRGELALDRPLFVLPIGAALSSLELTLLGLLRIPLAVSVAIVIIGSLAAIAVTQ